MGIKKHYHIFFVPRRSVACEQILKNENLGWSVMLTREYPLYMVPLKSDLISFELDFAFKDRLVDGDTSSLWHIAKAIHKLESCLGMIPNVHAKGMASTRIIEILDRMHKEEPSHVSNDVPGIDTLILLDRELDLVTPALTQLTYEGLLHELLDLDNCVLKVDASILPNFDGKEEYQKYQIADLLLDKFDKVFKDSGDLLFEAVPMFLEQAKEHRLRVNADFEAHLQGRTPSSDQIFVRAKRARYASLHLVRHSSLVQHLIKLTCNESFGDRVSVEHAMVQSGTHDSCYDYIEELIRKREPLHRVLRILILLCLTKSGLPEKSYDYYRKEIINNYGYKHIHTLNKLEKAGILKRYDGRSSWLAVKEALNLVVDNVDTAERKDAAYVYCGYAPLCVRLVQHAIKTGWHPVEKALKLLPGPHIEVRRGAPALGVSNRPAARRRTVLVVFVGGVTFAEISALRSLNSKELQVIVATTKVVNGRTLLEPFWMVKEH